jgi:hypothetical protein
MAIPDALEFLLPWRIISDSLNVERLSAELMSELSPNHSLYGVKARAVANRIDRDDVLFTIDSGRAPLAVVHLTWRKESDPRWPSARLFATWEEWVHDEMLPANEEYKS